eukprot:m.151100 g.151100  ORF g.151100 m.151100 type:complete len:99 (-) comp14243_c0_seq7:182-478(-)
MLSTHQEHGVWYIQDSNLRTNRVVVVLLLSLFGLRYDSRFMVLLVSGYEIETHCSGLSVVPFFFWMYDTYRPGTMLDIENRSGKCYGTYRACPCIWHV